MALFNYNYNALFEKKYYNINYNIYIININRQKNCQEEASALIHVWQKMNRRTSETKPPDAKARKFLDVCLTRFIQILVIFFNGSPKLYKFQHLKIAVAF